MRAARLEGKGENAFKHTQRRGSVGLKIRNVLSSYPLKNLSSTSPGDWNSAWFVCWLFWLCLLMCVYVLLCSRVGALIFVIAEE